MVFDEVLPLIGKKKNYLYDKYKKIKIYFYGNKYT